MRLKEFVQQKESAVTLVFFDENHKKMETITLSSILGTREIERRAEAIKNKSGYKSYEIIQNVGFKGQE